MRKKILLIITKSNFGGAQRYVYDLAVSLPPDQFDVAVVLGGNGILKERLEKRGVRTISILSLQRDINLKNELLSFKEIFLTLKKERPDIIHVNSSKAGGISSFWGRILGVRRIVFTAHAWAFNENRGTLSKIAIAFFHWLTVFFSHTTIAVSEAVKRQVSHLPFIGRKIRVIRLGIESPHFLSRVEAKKHLDIYSPYGSLAIVTLGELHPVKGLNFAIEAISLLRRDDPELFQKISYYIFGQGEEKEKLQGLIVKNGLENKIFLKGWKDDASRYLQAFDVFLLPSLSEALSYVLIEAGFAKIPVIASSVGGIPEIVEDHVTGRLFSKGNAEAIKLAIQESYQDQNASKKMADTLFNKIRNEFGLREMVQKTVDIYLE